MKKIDCKDVEISPFYETKRGILLEDDEAIGTEIRVLELRCDDDNCNWRFYVSFKDPDGVDHKVELPFKLFSDKGVEWKSILLDAGYGFYDWRSPAKLYEYFFDYHYRLIVRNSACTYKSLGPINFGKWK